MLRAVLSESAAVLTSSHRHVHKNGSALSCTLGLPALAAMCWRCRDGVDVQEHQCAAVARAFGARARSSGSEPHVELLGLVAPAGLRLAAEQHYGGYLTTSALLRSFGPHRRCAPRR